MKVKMGPYWQKNELGDTIIIPEEIIEKLKDNDYPVTTGFMPKNSNKEVPLEKIIGTLKFDSIKDNYIVADFEPTIPIEKDPSEYKFALRALCKPELQNGRINRIIKHILCWNITI